MSELKNRYDFAFIFDVQDGNPNGDPDAGNLPRIDPETGHGLVTDVCIKRKLRNFILLSEGAKPGHDIYVKEKAVLGRAHVRAFEELNISLGAESKADISGEVHTWLAQATLPEGLGIDSDEDTNTYEVIVAGDADKKTVKDWLKEAEAPKPVKDAVTALLKTAKIRKPAANEVEAGRTKMCQTYFDIRTFGAVMSLKSAPNCGQVRGPVQITFSRSVDPIVTLEHSITRMAVATEKEAAKQSGDNRTMGRKNTVPYGVYVGHGFVSPQLAKQTGFSEDDLSLLWKGFETMFEHDRSAARGLMSLRQLIVFKHGSPLGDAPAHRLFERITLKKKAEGPARKFADYELTIDKTGLPAGMEVLERPV